MHQLDALINGLAFVGLVVGLAIGWTRSAALRETLTELFLPSRRSTKPARRTVKLTFESNSALIGELSFETNDVQDVAVSQITVLWGAYLSQGDKPPTRSNADDTKTLMHVRELVSA